MLGFIFLTYFTYCSIPSRAVRKIHLNSDDCYFIIFPSISSDNKVMRKRLNEHRYRLMSDVRHLNVCRLVSVACHLNVCRLMSIVSCVVLMCVVYVGARVRLRDLRYNV